MAPRWRRHESLTRCRGLDLQKDLRTVTSMLQSSGAAFPSLPRCHDEGRHLLDRNSFPTVFNDDTGEQQRAVAPPWRFTQTPARIDRWTPGLGQHNLDVFSGILGLPEEEVRRLEEAQVVW